MRQNNLWIKLKAVYGLLTRKHIAIMSCGYCGSINIKKNVICKVGDEYSGYYQCCDCGAHVYETQKWLAR